MNKHHRVWSLQEAKAKFSEVVRLAQTEGPQEVTLHGKHVVTMVSAERDKAKIGGLTGKDFVAALSQGQPIDIELPERPTDGKFREIDLE